MRVRIIPALAGNTPCSASTTPTAGDHPRSRGEYGDSAKSMMGAMGSSPLSRGILRHLGTRHGSVGIIPALAGNTTTCSDPVGCTRDHPRSRGEYFDDFDTILYDEGSSPLSRGIHRRRGHGSGSSRIIPALAGNTMAPPLMRHMVPDHPRSRGEYINNRNAGLSREGSSPLSRGILAPRYCGSDAGRIIPALAGNTSSSR